MRGRRRASPLPVSGVRWIPTPPTAMGPGCSIAGWPGARDGPVIAYTGSAGAVRHGRHQAGPSPPPRLPPGRRDAMTGKPTVEELGIDIAAQRWRRSGDGASAIEIAMVRSPPHAGSPDGPPQPGTDWVLMRLAGDPAGRVLVYDRHEWECFLDGVRNGEFDDAPPDGAPAKEAPADRADD